MNSHEDDGATMIRSMTGYGRAEVENAGHRFTIEARSLNNRYLDIQIKTPRDLAPLEPRIKKIVQDRCLRGRFEIYVSRTNRSERAGRLRIDEDLAGQYVDVLNGLKTRFGLSGDVDLPMIAGFRDLVTVAEEQEDADAAWQNLSTGLTQALGELNRMRGEEGSVLVHDIKARLGAVEQISEVVRSRAPVTIENARKRMSDTLHRILQEPPEPLRLAQEIAILAEKTDVTEELTRLGSHVAQFRSLLDASAGEAVGRKLDFLLQEMGREVNTIASKAQDAKISLDVVTMKAELEKIREQVQNIE
jgi:uncharacterized protein (TIGR00255 family)